MIGVTELQKPVEAMGGIVQTYINGIMQLLLPVSLLAKSSCGKYHEGKQYDQIFQQEIFSKITRLLIVVIFKTGFLNGPN